MFGNSGFAELVQALGSIATAIRNDSGITKINHAKQSNVTNSTVGGARIEAGWGWMQNITGAAVGQMSEVVTFGTAFSSAPLVFLTFGGDAGNVPAVYGTGTRVSFGSAATNASDISASQFQATCTFASGGTLPNNSTIYYQWLAIGV